MASYYAKIIEDIYNKKIPYYVLKMSNNESFLLHVYDGFLALSVYRFTDSNTLKHNILLIEDNYAITLIKANRKNYIEMIENYDHYILLEEDIEIEEDVINFNDELFSALSKKANEVKSDPQYWNIDFKV